MSRPRVALATCAAFPHLDDDDGVLLPALERWDVEGVPAVWDDPGVDWAAFDLTVVRGTWDYAKRIKEFLQWTHRVHAACGLLNDPALIVWNTDKRYLEQLADAGVPVVPTTFLNPGTEGAFPDRGDYVIKPTVSAGSRDTARYRAGRDDQTARALVDRLHADGRTVMVQPYVDSVDDAGETAMLFIDGDWSHAIRKGPLLLPGAPPTEDLFAQETISTRIPTDAQRAVADAVVLTIPAVSNQPWLYARVDLLDTPDGPVVLELEMTEPSLFLTTDPGAADRLAAAIATRLPCRPRQP